MNSGCKCIAGGDLQEPSTESLEIPEEKAYSICIYLDYAPAQT